MKQFPFPPLSDAEHLGTLAMRFRSNRDPEARRAVARKCADTVQRLIDSGTWDEAPSPEDELPDAWMPAAYFEYWSEPSGVV